jgi:hypothetical protein
MMGRDQGDLHEFKRNLYKLWKRADQGPLSQVLILDTLSVKKRGKEGVELSFYGKLFTTNLFALIVPDCGSKPVTVIV